MIVGPLFPGNQRYGVFTRRRAANRNIRPKVLEACLIRDRAVFVAYVALVFAENSFSHPNSYSNTQLVAGV